ncbi:hypothetical protein [Nostoc sp. 106C]|nr:hypothetical protein [Nostoc sp. 106C]
MNTNLTPIVKGDVYDGLSLRTVVDKSDRLMNNKIPDFLKKSGI